MPRITEDLVRRRAEHNEGEIASLEELSLHQQEIEKIEHLDKWCRSLKILYLQNNLIPKIENVGRLKQLEYLNLALNNIEKIENLEGCEFLNKLDLTVNFVGDLLSVESLQANHHFRELYLTGNPCTDYEGYREYVVAILPRLQWLDGKEVTKSERIIATQKYKELRERIVHQQRVHEAKREEEKAEYREKEERKEKKKENKSKPGFDGRWYTDTKSHQQTTIGEGAADRPVQDEEDEEEREFWNETTAYTPESRTEVHQYMAEKRKEKAKSPENKGLKPQKRRVRFERDGKMLNINEARYDFQLKDDEENNQYVLEVSIPRFMDTSLVECDVQTTYVRLTIKGKVLQLVLDEEVSPDRSIAKRSQTSGHLLLTLPKAKEMVKRVAKKQSTTLSTPSSSSSSRDRLHHGAFSKTMANQSKTLAPTPTAPTSPATASVDFRNIVKHEKEMEEEEEEKEGGSRSSKRDEAHMIKELESNGTKDADLSFSDDSDVPPLI